MQNRKDFKIETVYTGPEYDKFYDGNSASDPQIVLSGKTHVKPEPEEEFNGIDKGFKDIKVQIDSDVLSKHFLIVGGIGMGKTNTFLSMTDQLIDKCTEKDVMVIFDTKGDFYNTFGSHENRKDIFLSNAPLKDANGHEKVSSKEEIWNIFKELDEDKLTESSNEIAGMIFADAIKKSSNPFFPQAAKAIFAAILRELKRCEMALDMPLSNKLLKALFNGENIGLECVRSNNVLDVLAYLLSKRERGALSYLTAGDKVENNGQTQGIIAELQMVIDEIFIGNFAKEGSFSIREAVRERGGKKIYIQYDITEGSVLTPIYSLLVDLAIKESLESRHGKKGNAYFIVDEFKLLPNLNHIDDAVNFGRSIGVKFIIGVQNISQIINNYGEDNAKNILSGFSSIIAYRVADYETRKYIVDTLGQNKKRIAYLSAISSRGVIESVEKANVVEDWDILNLDVGECIVRLARKYGAKEQSNPFFLKVDPFKKEI